MMEQMRYSKHKQMFDFTAYLNAPASPKPTALNQAAALATGDIYVFTDARQRLSKDAISALVTALGDPAVGVASGELVMHANSNTESRSVGLYWHYEKWSRSNEARVHSIPGATGALYAIANDDYASIPADTLLDDFDIPINVLRRKKRIVMVPEAIAYDHAVEEISKERIRKVRTLTGNFQSFARHPWLFNPFMNPIFWQFISHKVFRLLVPYALFVLLIGSIVLREWWATLFALLQVSFYTVAWLCAQLPQLRKDNRLLNFIHTFVELNTAAVIAAFNYCTRNDSITWEKTD